MATKTFFINISYISVFWLKHTSMLIVKIDCYCLQNTTPPPNPFLSCHILTEFFSLYILAPILSVGPVFFLTPTLAPPSLLVQTSLYWINMLRLDRNLICIILCWKYFSPFLVSFTIDLFKTTALKNAMAPAHKFNASHQRAPARQIEMGFQKKRHFIRCGV